MIAVNHSKPLPANAQDHQIPEPPYPPPRNFALRVRRAPDSRLALSHRVPARSFFRHPCGFAQVHEKTAAAKDGRPGCGVRRFGFVMSKAGRPFIARYSAQGPCQVGGKSGASPTPGEEPSSLNGLQVRARRPANPPAGIGNPTEGDRSETPRASHERKCRRSLGIASSAGRWATAA